MGRTLRNGVATLATVLDEGAMLIHPFVIGELACANLENREEVLRLLAELRASPIASDTETAAFHIASHAHGDISTFICSRR